MVDVEVEKVMRMKECEVERVDVMFWKAREAKEEVRVEGEEVSVRWRGWVWKGEV